ncbi:hypothetical protein BS47DRAFT_1397760 [Hydnum rufescens UP504]|uniref:Secreted protein n=1 Tax=Hydnum rufescens UP504 TaxID=1448309 RepID=A0A9P6DNY7_9AGAM|nr:hypothetical protein BS47DRAFT_1397760 [Hydnum rufescens UP504]
MITPRSHFSLFLVPILVLNSISSSLLQYSSYTGPGTPHSSCLYIACPAAWVLARVPPYTVAPFSAISHPTPRKKRRTLSLHCCTSINTGAPARSGRCEITWSCADTFVPNPSDPPRTPQVPVSLIPRTDLACLHPLDRRIHSPGPLARIVRDPLDDHGYRHTGGVPNPFNPSGSVKPTIILACTHLANPRTS